MYDPYNERATSSTTTATTDPMLKLPPPQQNSGPPTGTNMIFDPVSETQKYTANTPEAAALAPPSAADALEDLLGLGLHISTTGPGGSHPDNENGGQTGPEVQQQWSQQVTQEHVEETFEEILGLEGLSEEDREALLEEQKRILAAIEQENKGKSPLQRKADAFEQRSLSRAVVAQQQTPVVHDDLEAAQLAADEELARELQREEYKRAERQRPSSQTNAPAPAPQSEGSSWMEWLGFGPPPGTGPSGPPPSFAQRPLQRGEIGVSLPAGSRRVETETVTFSGGADSNTGSSFSSSPQQDRMRGMGSSPQRGAVAQQKPIFACVADSITQATQMATDYATQAMYGDMEVDHSSLLRSSSHDDNDTGGYSQMPGGGS